MYKLEPHELDELAIRNENRKVIKDRDEEGKKIMRITGVILILAWLVTLLFALYREAI